MPEIEHPDLIKVKKLIIENHYEEANSLLTALEGEETLTDLEKLSCYNLKSAFLNKKGNYEEALNYGKKTLKKSQELRVEIQTLDALINITYSSMWIGDYGEAIKNIDEGEVLLKKLQKRETPHLKKREGDFYFTKAGLNYWLGNAEGMTFAKRSLEIREELGEKSDIAQSLFMIGAFYGILKTDLDTGVSYAERAQNLAEETNNFRLLAMILMNLGIIYAMKGEHSRALEFNLKCLPMFEQNDNIILTCAILSNIAFSYSSLGKIDKAFKYIDKASDYALKIQNKFVIMTLIANKVDFSIEMGRLEEAKEYFDQMKEIEIQNDNPMTEHTYRLTETQILKSLPGIENQEKAEIKLKELLSDNITKMDIKITALTFLCEILFKKLKRTNNSEILDEISSILNSLTNIAEESNSFWVLAETYTLQAKLAMLILDFNEARRLLTQAQKIAEDQGIQYLAKKISIEHDNFLQEMNKLESLKENAIPLSERINIMHIEDQMKDMIWKRDLSTLKTPAEIPVVLLVLKEGGTPIFSHIFSKEWSFESDLFGGFLSAINSFSGELFDEGLDRARFGKHTIIMSQMETFSVCYLFKGQSYQAHKRINYFIDQIQRTAEIWNEFNFSSKVSRLIEYKYLPELKSIVNEIFISGLLEITDI